MPYDKQVLLHEMSLYSVHNLVFLLFNEHLFFLHWHWVYVTVACQRVLMILNIRILRAYSTILWISKAQSNRRLKLAYHMSEPYT